MDSRRNLLSIEWLHLPHVVVGWRWFEILCTVNIEVRGFRAVPHYVLPLISKKFLSGFQKESNVVPNYSKICFCKNSKRFLHVVQTKEIFHGKKYFLESCMFNYTIAPEVWNTLCTQGNFSLYYSLGRPRSFILVYLNGSKIN